MPDQKGAASTASPSAPEVVVAHDSEPIRAAVCRLLVEAGYRVTAVADGHAALAAISAGTTAVVLDAAISGVFSYEITDAIRTHGWPAKTLLIASVYNRAGYKRRPTSLYGADDYVEQHHIPDLMLLKLANLLGRPIPDGKQVDAAVARDEEQLRNAGEGRLTIRYANLEEGVARARRLARLIVADIALYNKDLHALPDDAEREARLREDLEEGRLLFDLRVPREIRDGTDFVGEALAEWVRRSEGQPVEGATTEGTAPAPTRSTRVESGDR